MMMMVMRGGRSVPGLKSPFQSSAGGAPATETTQDSAASLASAFLSCSNLLEKQIRTLRSNFFIKRIFICHRLLKQKAKHAICNVPCVFVISTKPRWLGLLAKKGPIKVWRGSEQRGGSRNFISLS